MVDVAQLVEPWIVIPAVVGSSPIVHPKFRAILMVRVVATGMQSPSDGRPVTGR